MNHPTTPCQTANAPVPPSPLYIALEALRSNLTELEDQTRNLCIDRLSEIKLLPPNMEIKGTEPCQTDAPPPTVCALHANIDGISSRIIQLRKMVGTTTDELQL